MGRGGVAGREREGEVGGEGEGEEGGREGYGEGEGGKRGRGEGEKGEGVSGLALGERRENGKGWMVVVKDLGIWGSERVFWADLGF